MKKLEKVILIPLILLTSVFTSIPYAHAATGLVCLADAAATSCPASPPTFDQAPGALLNIAVRVQGSDALNGFDIQVKGDPAFLSASDASVTGGILAFAPVVKCINGLLKAGSSCAPQDGPGVVHLAAVSFGGLTVPPTSGLLFTAVFKVVAGTGLSSIPISFNTGCSGTSVANVCVTITNGSPGAPPVSQTVQGALFTHGPDFTVTANTSITVAPGFKATIAISLASLAGFADFISFDAFSSVGAFPNSFDVDGNPIVTPPAPPIGVSLSPASVSLLAGGTASSTLTVGPAANSVPSFCDINGTPCDLFPVYTVTVTGTSSAFVSHSVDIAVIDTPQDVSITATPDTHTILIGTSATSTISLTSISALAGSVSLTSSTTPSGPTTVVNPATVSLTAYGTVSAMLTITIPATADFAAYVTTVTATVGTVSRSVDVRFAIRANDFNLAAVPDSLVVLSSLAGSAEIIVSSVSTVGPVSLSANVVKTGATVPGNCSPCSTIIANNLIPTTVILTLGGSARSTFSVLSTADSAPGNYTTTITATGGGVTHRTFVTFTIGDFKISLSATSLVAIPGTSAKSTIRGEILGGFTATFINALSFLGATNPEVTRVPQLGPKVNLRLVQVYYPNGTRVRQTIGFPGGTRTCLDCGVFGPIASVSTRQISPDPFAGPARATLTVAATSQTPSGDYTVSVTGIVGPLLHTVTANVYIPKQPQFNAFQNVNTLSLSGSGGTLTFIGGATNVDPRVTLYISIQVRGVDSTGTKTFTAKSIVVQLLPGQSISSLAITAMLGAGTLGTTYTYVGTIQYGLTATALTASSLAISTDFSGTSIAGESATPISGTLTVIA